MESLAERDYFTDHSILRDPYAYFEAIRAKGPIYKLPDRDIVVVTGFNEMLEVFKDTEHFSSVLAPQGPAAPMPFKPEGEDITSQIEAHRTEFIGGDLLVAYDDKPHAFSRALISRLFTPSRLKANEQFIADYADELVRGAVAKGGCELIKEIATPFVTLVIADLLGVPPDDRQLFMEAIESGVGAGSLDPDDLAAQNQPLGADGHVLHAVRPGAARQSDRRRAFRAGQRDLPGRHDPGRDGDRAAGHLPVRRRARTPAPSCSATPCASSSTSQACSSSCAPIPP